MILDDVIFRLREDALDILRGVSKGEASTWYAHPLTQALVKRLEADYLDFHAGLGNGDYTSESTEGSKQLYATAVGQIKAIEQVIGAIKDTADPLDDEEKDDYSNWA